MAYSPFYISPQSTMAAMMKKKEYLGDNPYPIPTPPDPPDIKGESIPEYPEVFPMPSNGKRCYQCDAQVEYLFSDGRCHKCTRQVEEEVRGNTGNYAEIFDIYYDPDEDIPW